MKAVYVVSTPDRVPKNLFKVGRTTQSQENLRRRYLTALINPLILFYIPVEDEVEAEKSLHNALDHYRVENSEWFHCELPIIINHVCNLSTHRKSEDVMTDDKKLFQWITRETPIVDFIITKKNPIVGYYRLSVNGQAQNFWLAFPGKGRAGFLELLRVYVKREAPFWLEQQKWDDIMKEVSPLNIVANSRVSSFCRSRLHFHQVNKGFLEFCIDCILSLCYKQLPMRTRFTLNAQNFSSKEKVEGRGGNSIVYMDPKTKIMGKYIVLPERGTLFEERELEETRRVVMFHSPELPLCEPPPHNFFSPPLESQVFKDDLMIQFGEFMKRWIPSWQNREAFRLFGRGCFMGSKGKYINQRSSLSAGTTIFDPFLKPVEGSKVMDGLEIEHFADRTLVSEYLATVLNYFYPNSVVRLYGYDAYSWGNVKEGLNELSPYTSTFPKLVLVYSSVLRWSPEMSFKNMEVEVAQWHSRDVKEVERLSGVPNYVVVSPISTFDNFEHRSTSIASPFSVDEGGEEKMKEFMERNGSFVEKLTSSAVMWTALKWFFS